LDVYALPLDIFRIAVGAASLGYLLHILSQFGIFTNPAGLIDHALVQSIYPYTRISLFQSGTPAAVLYAALLCGLPLSVGLIIGWRPKLCAGALFVLVVSHARWNFLVMHIDDTVLGLMLFWLCLMPIGKTLILSEWRRAPKDALRKWKTLQVPGASTVSLSVLVRLGYLIAAGWKFAAPMWQDGFALYATLKLPFAYASDFWNPSHIPALASAAHAAMLIELSIPFLLSFPPGAAAKRLGLLLQIALHAGIIITLPFPVANLLMLASALLIFNTEIGRRLSRTPPAKKMRCLKGREWLTPALVCIFALSVLRDIPILGAFSRPATAVLWSIGLYENFRLFDWIDEKNLSADIEVTRETPSGPVPAVYTNPAPPSLRMAILSGYLVGDPAVGSLWIPIPWRHRGPLKNSLLFRAADKFCAQEADGTYNLWATLKRITPENADLSKGQRFFFLEAACAGGRPVLCRSYVNPRVRSLCTADTP
jgi:hypothetical protein